MNDPIDKLVELSIKKDILPDYICHYTSIDIIPKIFAKDSLCFKLTKINNFKDKLEGKSSDVFYDIALEELATEKIINEAQRIKLENITIARAGFLYQRETDKMKLFKSGIASTYIGCFSTLYNDYSMIEQYIKNKNHEGICIKLNPHELFFMRHDIDLYGYNVTIKRVRYGREIVDEFKNLIYDLINISGGIDTDLFNRFGMGILKSKLAEIKYTAKTGRFRNEQEYRIILQIPQRKPRGYVGHDFEKIPGGVLFDVYRRSLIEYKYINTTTQNERNIHKYMEENYYDHYLSL